MSLKMSLAAIAILAGAAPAGAQTGADREPAGGAFMSSYAQAPSASDGSAPGLLTSTARRPYSPADLTTGSITPRAKTDERRWLR